MGGNQGISLVSKTRLVVSSTTLPAMLEYSLVVKRVTVNDLSQVRDLVLQPRGGLAQLVELLVRLGGVR